MRLFRSCKTLLVDGCHTSTHNKFVTRSMAKPSVSPTGILLLAAILRTDKSP